ncbi:hypothetical protein GP486_000379 [Trichoglossum hirsutum]|uniref:Protein prenyltransferase n=1 Tax=Trichoglossum hirsutum TaxID=265104 RepID=A0A9P8LJ12_9PEZI|nr:hypothetical protein GP486_000379 [Trichoglossum hirsutum]
MAETDAYKAFRDYVDLSRVQAIEILPSNFIGFPSAEGCSQLILVDDTSIGVPKKVLIRAFITARQNLYSLLEISCPSADTDDALLATFVILLFDPEHLTAANFRKKIILLEGQKDTADDSLGRLTLQATQRELIAIETLLTSPLHRHNKSPTLWSHRRWVLGLRLTYFRQEKETGSEFFDADWLWRHVYRPELLIVMKAGEQHPRNYYAWSHARWLIENFRSSNGAGLSSSLADGMKLVQRWCLKHQSDTSGWSFLLFLHIQAGKEVHLQDLAVSSAEEVLYFTLNFDWDLESVWVFLRNVLASPSLLPEEQRLVLIGKVRRKLEEAEVKAEDESKPNMRFIQKALVWIDLYGGGESTVDRG